MNTPRSCFLGSSRAVLEGMPEIIWKFGKGNGGLRTRPRKISELPFVSSQSVMESLSSSPFPSPLRARSRVEKKGP